MKKLFIMLLIVVAGCCPVFLPDKSDLEERPSIELIEKILDNPKSIEFIAKDTAISTQLFRNNFNELKIADVSKIIEKSFHCNCRYLKSEKKAVLSDNDKFAVANFILFEDETKKIDLVFTFIKRNDKWLIDDLQIVNK